MASPFVEDPVELGVQIVRGSLRKARVFRDQQNTVAFLDSFLYERYKFSSEGMTYLCQPLEPWALCCQCDTSELCTYSPADCTHCLALLCYLTYLATQQFNTDSLRHTLCKCGLWGVPTSARVWARHPFPTLPLRGNPHYCRGPAPQQECTPV